VVSWISKLVALIEEAQKKVERELNKSQGSQQLTIAAMAMAPGRAFKAFNSTKEDEVSGGWLICVCVVCVSGWLVVWTALQGVQQYEGRRGKDG
jgi:lysylphosphatidylglycerol synthetase-like protein (DUF2156 family)